MIPSPNEGSSEVLRFRATQSPPKFSFPVDTEQTFCAIQLPDLPTSLLDREGEGGRVIFRQTFKMFWLELSNRTLFYLMSISLLARDISLHFHIKKKVSVSQYAARPA